MQEKSKIKNDDIINEQQLAEEMKKIVKQKVMQKSLIQAKFDTMQNKLNSLAN